MRNARRVSRSLSRKDAVAELLDTAAMLRALGQTSGPRPLCAGLRKYGIGWAVYVGEQGTERPWASERESSETQGDGLARYAQ
jgi:hypothetical protein